MFMSLLSHALSAWFAFLLPCYATFKALSNRPLSEPDLQKWSMYWTVIGVFVAFEYLAEWLISWVPFYWELKTLFLLFLSLPQTQGSTFVYNTYLQPFFVKNEAQLDAGIISIQRNTLIFLQARLSALWETAWGIINKNPAAGQPGPSSVPSDANRPPALSLQSAMELWKTYGSSLLSTFQTSGTTRGVEPSASTSATQGISAERRAPRTFEQEPSHVAAPPSPSGSPPLFPVPQHA